jgi:hypothetical protein
MVKPCKALSGRLLFDTLIKSGSSYYGFPAQILPGIILSVARRMQRNIELDPQSIGGWSVA